MSLSPIEDALAALRRGEIIIVVDDEERENEGDLIMAAEFATPESIAFFLKHTSGFICVTVEDDRADELALPLMVERNTESHKTAFTVTVDAIEGVTTGISSHDRARTIRALVDPSTKPGDLARPGHVHVLRAKPGGVLERGGHTEAGCDLTRLAGLTPISVICEVVTEDKLDMARLPELQKLAAEHGLPIISIADLIEFRKSHPETLSVGKSVLLPTPHGEFRCRSFTPLTDKATHHALTLGDVADATAPLVRIHSECLTGDVFASQRCDCGEQLEESMRRIASEGVGVIVYLRGHEGRGVGLDHKLEAYLLQEQGLDTVDAMLALDLPVDARDYTAGAQILRWMGIRCIRLLTNNPEKTIGLTGNDIEVVEQILLPIVPNSHNITYLETKRDRMGHQMEVLNDQDL